MPETTRTLRARIIYDYDADLSYLEQPEFAGTDPDDIESLAVVAEALCPCCGRWEGLSASLWGIDVMQDDRTVWDLPYEGDPATALRSPDVEGGTYTDEQLAQMVADAPHGRGRAYVADVALDVLSEARSDLEPPTLERMTDASNADDQRLR